MVGSELSQHGIKHGAVLTSQGKSIINVLSYPFCLPESGDEEDEERDAAPNRAVLIARQSRSYTSKIEHFFPSAFD